MIFFDVASFDNENDAKEFCKIVNELGIDRTQALIQEQLTTQHDQATAQVHNKQEIYCINFSRFHDLNEGIVFHSKDAAIQCYEESKSSAIENMKAII